MKKEIRNSILIGLLLSFTVLFVLGFLTIFNKNYIRRYMDKYNYIPPFILVKVLSFGVISSLYGLLEQSDRQQISKYFKISDKLLKQILKNLTGIRNICAHNERLFCFRDKYTMNFIIKLYLFLIFLLRALSANNLLIIAL